MQQLTNQLKNNDKMEQNFKMYIDANQKLPGFKTPKKRSGAVQMSLSNHQKTNSEVSKQSMSQPGMPKERRLIFQIDPDLIFHHKQLSEIEKARAVEATNQTSEANTKHQVHLQYLDFRVNKKVQKKLKSFANSQAVQKLQHQKNLEQIMKNNPYFQLDSKSMKHSKNKLKLDQQLMLSIGNKPQTRHSCARTSIKNLKKQQPKHLSKLEFIPQQYQNHGLSDLAQSPMEQSAKLLQHIQNPAIRNEKFRNQFSNSEDRLQKAELLDHPTSRKQLMEFYNNCNEEEWKQQLMDIKEMQDRVIEKYISKDKLPKIRDQNPKTEISLSLNHGELVHGSGKERQAHSKSPFRAQGSFQELRLVEVNESKLQKHSLQPPAEVKQNARQHGRLAPLKQNLSSSDLQTQFLDQMIGPTAEEATPLGTSSPSAFE